MKTEPTEALKEIKRCTWETGNFKISSGFESYEVVDKDDAINIANIAFNEAIRWRDPKVELPENGEPVIVKYMTARGIKKYGIGKFFELGIGNPWTIEGTTGREVIGWRPIE